MAIYKEEKHEPILKKTSTELETAVILNSSKQNEVITNNISGYRWKVDYYNQILGKMDPPKTLDIALNPTLQSYRIIENAEIILSSPITSVSTTNINGDGYIDIRSGVHKGDLFIAPVHNKVGIFYIEEVRAESYEDNTIYNVTFKFNCFTSDKPTYDNIISKIATRYIFNPNYRFSNQKPILLKSEVFDYSKGLNYIENVMLHYYQRFFITKNKLVMDKDSLGNKLLDLYLNKFIKTVFSNDVVKWVDKMEYQDIEEYSTLNIFDGIIKHASLRLLDKLRIISLPTKYNSVYYKDVFNVHAMSGYEGNLDFYTKSYFIDDDFYTKELIEYDDTDYFEVCLNKFINMIDINIEEAYRAVESVINDEFAYYKIPIMVFIYYKVLEKIKI